jgi:hypothetical protein
MHKFLITVVILSIVGLLSCSSESGGGSDAPAIKLEGAWDGTMDAVDEAGDKTSMGTFEVTFEYSGFELSDGSLISDRFVTTCPDVTSPCVLQRCPSTKQPVLAGTQRGNDIDAFIVEVGSDRLEWKLEVVDTDRIEGTYEYTIVEPDEPCADQTGVVTMDRRSRS